MKPNSNLNHLNNFCFILIPRLLINIVFFLAKTAPRAPKLGYFDGVNNGIPTAGVIGHISYIAHLIKPYRKAVHS